MNKKSNNSEFLKIITKFSLFSLIIYFILLPFESALILPVTEHSFQLINLFVDSKIQGNSIVLSNVSLIIVGACTGITSIAVILGFVFATSKTLKEYLLGSVICTSLIYLGNILRIVIIGILSNIFGAPELFHGVVGYSSVLVVTVTTVFIWFEIQKRIIFKKVEHRNI